jgi:hypothetical protein
LVSGVSSLLILKNRLWEDYRGTPQNMQQFESCSQNLIIMITLSSSSLHPLLFLLFLSLNNPINNKLLKKSETKPPQHLAVYRQQLVSCGSYLKPRCVVIYTACIWFTVYIGCRCWLSLLVQTSHRPSTVNDSKQLGTINKTAFKSWQTYWGRNEFIRILISYVSSA